MPLYNITTSFKFNKIEKCELMKQCTKFMTELNIAKDKIQIIINESDRINLSRAGVSLESSAFSLESRIENKKNISKKENLIIIEIDIWKNFSKDQKLSVGKKLTNYIKETFNFLGENILIIYRDIDPLNWIQNGVAGDNSQFLSESRK